MINRTILLLIGMMILLPQPAKAQQTKEGLKKYLEFIESKEFSELCEYGDFFPGLWGFSSHMTIDQQRAFWSKSEDKIIEYIVFVHLSPDYKVDSVSLELIGTPAEVVRSAFEVTKGMLNQRLTEWPSCDIPVQIPDESWTIVVPFSCYSLELPSGVQWPRTATPELKKAISRYAKHHLSVVYPIGIYVWMGPIH